MMTPPPAGDDFEHAPGPGGTDSATGKRPAHLVLIGGAGDPCGVASHLHDLSGVLGTDARITILHDTDRGGYGFAQDHTSIELPGLRSRAGPGVVHGLRRLWSVACQLRAVLRAQPADLIWAHEALGVLLLRLLSAVDGRIRTTPLAVTFHALPVEPQQRAGLRPILRGAEALCLVLSPPMVLIFLTDGARRAYLRAFPRLVTRHRTLVLGNGLARPRSCATASIPAPVSVPAPASRSCPPPGPQSGGRLLFAGRAAWQKQPEAAARILAHLPPAWTLAFCGTGTDAPDFIAAMRHAAGPASGRITFAGPQSDMAPWYAHTDLLLMPSRYEGLPLAALEAFCARRPVALAPGWGAQAIVAAHPFATVIDPKAPAQAAARVRDVMARVAGCAQAEDHMAAAWAQSPFAKDIWAPAVRAVVAQIVGTGSRTADPRPQIHRRRSRGARQGHTPPP